MLLDRSLRPTENCKFRFSRQDSLEKQSTSCLLVGGEERWLSQARGHLIKKEHAIMQFFGEANLKNQTYVIYQTVTASTVNPPPMEADHGWIS